MRHSFANLLPAREARRCSDRLHCGSVKDYVRQLVQVVRELEGTPNHPGGSVFADFIKGLKSDMCRFVQDHATTGWWNNISGVYQNALDYEVNSLANGRVRDHSLNVLTSQRLADLVTLMCVAMQARKETAPLGPVLGVVPPRRAVAQVVTLGKAPLSTGVANPRRVECGSPGRRLLPGRHTRCVSGPPKESHIGKDYRSEETVEPSFVGRSQRKEKLPPVS